MTLRLRISRLLLALLAGGALLLLLLTVDYMRASIREEMEAGSRVATRLLGAWLEEQGRGDPAALKRFLGNLGRVRANEIRFLKNSDALRRLWAAVLAPPAALSQSPSPLLLPLLLPRPASVLLVRAPRSLAFKPSVCKGCSSKL